jgi:hypothetical protein
MRIYGFALPAVIGMVLAMGGGLAAPSGEPSAATRASAVAVVEQFFKTINAKQFAKTCNLMSARFYRENHVPDKRACALGLAAVFTMSPTIFFRITGVSTDGELTIVRSVANGAPGSITLVRESGTLKILSVKG